MRELAGVMEQLRSVRFAERRFLRLWAIEQAVILPALDRVAADIRKAAHAPASWDLPGTARSDGESPVDD